MLWRLRNVELVSVERISAEILKKKKKISTAIHSKCVEVNYYLMSER